MRLENLIFLIFLVAIAITLGSTLAIVSSLSAQASFQDTMGTNASSQSFSLEITKDLPLAATAETDIKESLVAGFHATLTPEETEEVTRMLKELGHTSSSLSESLKYFQGQHQIAITGILDIVTLNSIINQLSLTKAQSYY